VDDGAVNNLAAANECVGFRFSPPHEAIPSPPPKQPRQDLICNGQSSWLGVP
jgi:hypothetical protein